MQIAQNTSGVEQVKDNLSIRGENLPDNQVAQNLRDALARSLLVDAEDVMINVNNGKVTLTGDVASNFEKWSAGDIAARTRGVIEVRNELVQKDMPELTTWRFYYPWHSSYYPWTYSYSDEPTENYARRCATNWRGVHSPMQRIYRFPLRTVS